MIISFKLRLSLRAQLYSLVIAIALVTFIGTLWVNINTTRTYLNEQMATHAQDAATSVGLSISPYMDSENIVIAETMISAIFDSGYYQKALLSDADGKTLLLSENTKHTDDVPSWFIVLFELSPPLMSSEVNNGWNIAGELSFQSHVGSSYSKLWQHAVNNCYATLLITLIALIIAHYILRAVLTPLSQVEAQALLVSQKNFTFINKLPMTRELKNVVNAMNTMVSNIQSSFNLMSQQADKVTQELYIDSLTQLGNRRAFDNQFTTMVNEMQLDDLASIGLVQLHSLQEINMKFGYQAGDDYVCKVANLITEQLRDFTNAKVYRVNGGSFFFTITNTGEEVNQACLLINQNFQSINSEYYANGFASVVATTFAQDTKQGELLSKLDTLSTQENSNTSSGKVYQVATTSNGLGLQEWAELIAQLVRANQIIFTFQPIERSKSLAIEPFVNNGADSFNNVFYFEFFSKFIVNGQEIANNQLYAMAERTNKSEELDKLVITALLKQEALSSAAKIAINITQQSLHSKDFQHWLINFISKHKHELPRLVFEINEEAIISSVKSSIDFIGTLKSLNIEICIDRFGASFTSFKYLNGLNVDFLKIDGSYINGLASHEENKHFIQAVTQIGHGVGIKILTNHVEDKQTKQLLMSLDCDGLQGNYIQKALTLAEKDDALGCFYSPVQLS